MNKDINCIVATIAFGMGIDHPVHLVIHYGLSNDIESYYQEIGRAGRDGIESTCVLFWNKKDIMVAKSFLKTIENDDLRKHRELKLKLIEKYVLSDGCRKHILLNYFGETFDGMCNKCDNCIKKVEQIKSIYDPAPLFEPSYLIIKTFILTNKGLGSGKLIDILRGMRNKGVMEYSNIETYGKCKKYSIQFLKELINFLTYKDYLVERTIKKSSITYLTVHKNGIDLWIKIKEPHDIYKHEIWNFNEIPESYKTLYTYLPSHNTIKDKFNRLDDYEKIIALDDEEFN